MSNPLNFFSENVDAWGAAEWFNRLATAVRQQNEAVLANDEVTMEICRNVAASSAMRLVRDYERQVRAALAAQSAAPVGGQVPVCCYCDTSLSCAACGMEQPADAAPPPSTPSEITDAMCLAAVEANTKDRIQGFSYDKRHVIRDVWLPHDQQELWSSPVGGTAEYQVFQTQCLIERMRLVLAAALSPAKNQDQSK